VENKCISVDDMMELLTSEKFTDENRSRLFKINAHLYKCDNCRESYNKVSILYEFVENWSIQGQYETEQRLQNMKASLALIKTQKSSSASIASRIDNWVQNHVFSSAKVLVAVSDSIKMVVDETCAFIADATRMELKPVAVSRGLAGEDAQSSTNKVLIDRNQDSNKIKVDGNRKISITLSKSSDLAPLVAFIPNDIEKAAIVADMDYDHKNDCWVVEVDNLKEGEYDLLVESL